MHETEKVTIDLARLEALENAAEALGVLEGYMADSLERVAQAVHAGHPDGVDRRAVRMMDAVDGYVSAHERVREALSELTRTRVLERRVDVAIEKHGSDDVMDLDGSSLSFAERRRALSDVVKRRAFADNGPAPTMTMRFLSHLDTELQRRIVELNGADPGSVKNGLDRIREVSAGLAGVTPAPSPNRVVDVKMMVGWIHELALLEVTDPR